MELPDRSQARSWEGKDVVDSDGSRLGRCVGVFADTATGQPEWLHIDVEGHVRSFVPAIDAVEHDGAVRVRFSRSAVLGAPSVGDDVQLSKAEEIELYRHYGVPVEDGEGSVLPADDAAAAAGAGGDSATPTSATSTSATSTSATSTAVGTAAAAGAVTPVAGIADRTSTAASSSSGADTSVAETDAGTGGGTGVGTGVGTTGGLHDRTGDTTALTPTTVADGDTAPGGVVTPETGEELPVLDPAAASTHVPEDQVTYVDQPEGSVDDGADVPPPEAAPAAAPELLAAAVLVRSATPATGVTAPAAAAVPTAVEVVEVVEDVEVVEAVEGLRSPVLAVDASSAGRTLPSPLSTGTP